MPADTIIKMGDKVKFTFPPPTVVFTIQSPQPLVGSAKATQVGGAPACLEGDELPKSLLSPQPYTEAPFLTPGTGTLSIKLTANNKTAVAGEGGKPLLLKGATFQVEFQVVSPAIDPTTGNPDSRLKKSGTGQFITDNSFAQSE